MAYLWRVVPSQRIHQAAQRVISQATRIAPVRAQLPQACRQARGKGPGVYTTATAL